MKVYISAKEIREVSTFDEASAAVRDWIEGGNPTGEWLGASQWCRGKAGVLLDDGGARLGRVHYNGSVEPVEVAQ